MSDTRKNDRLNATQILNGFRNYKTIGLGEVDATIRCKDVPKGTRTNHSAGYTGAAAINLRNAYLDEKLDNE